jgi:hypothetical protein
LPIDLLHPFDSDKIKMLPANPAVGNVNNNGPEMLDEPDSLSGSLLGHGNAYQTLAGLPHQSDDG